MTDTPNKFVTYRLTTEHDGRVAEAVCAVDALLVQKGGLRKTLIPFVESIIEMHPEHLR